MTLNEIVSASSAPPPEIVKIDAEGFDLKVLAGASDLLGKTDIFFVEVTICCPGHENTIARVVQRMDEAGYHVVDVTDINRSPKYGSCGCASWLSCETAALCSTRRLTFLHKRDGRTPRILLEFPPYCIRKTR